MQVDSVAQLALSACRCDNAPQMPLEEHSMVGFLRLLVCGGLFAAGYYLGRQSCRMESEQDQSGIFDEPDGVPGSGNVGPDKEQPGG